MNRPIFKFSSFFVFLCISMIAMFIGSRFTMATTSCWYKSLTLPAFTPPNIVFPIVWTILYVLIALAASFLWQAPKHPDRSKALLFWGLQLLFNIAWPILFFGLHAIFIAFIGLCVLWVFTLICMIYSFKSKPIAGYLLLPYILWLSFAFLLNLSILLNNT